MLGFLGYYREDFCLGLQTGILDLGDALKPAVLNTFILRVFDSEV